MRVAFIAAECEPWAKTGGLGDVVDALARALGRIDRRARRPGRRLPAALSGDDPARRRAPPATDPGARPARRRTARPRSPIVDVVSHGYRLRLVDHPPAFDRAGYYGEPSGGDYPDNAWRFGLFCRAALETLRADNRPVDVIHLHDWHAAPAVDPARPVLRRRPDRRASGRADHDPQPRLPRLGPARPARPARARPGRPRRRRRRRRDRPAPGGRSSGPSWRTRSARATPPRR